MQLQEAITRGLSTLRTTEPMIGRVWADKYFYLSPESSGTEGRWRTYPYQIGIINWMTSDDIEEVNWQKSRRVGYTKCLLAAAGYYIHQKKRNIVTWQPTDGDARDFVTDEVDTALRDVPTLGDMLKAKVGNKSKFNTVEKKVFNGATWDIKGGKSARNYRRMTKDVAIYDETDGFDLDIDGEGSCFELGDGRLDQAPYPKSIRGSTPKTKNASLIETAVNDSDYVFLRYVRCIHCGEMQPLLFENLKWYDGDASTAHFVCRVNGCVLYYRDYPEMDRQGRWQTSDGVYYSDETDKFYNANDEVIPKPRCIGAKIWAAYSYLRPWSYVVEKWIKATAQAKSGSITSLKSVINTLLGETFEEKGESVEATGFIERLEEYTDDKLPVEVLAITIGADVQGGKDARVELEILGHGLEGESWSIDYVVIKGDIEDRSMHAHIDDQFKRKFKREDGVELGVSGMFVDSGFETTQVYRYTAPRRKYRIFSTKGVNTGTLCNKGTWQGEKKFRTILHTTNVDEAKETLYRRLKIQDHGPGYCHFPAHYEQHYFDQLTNEEKREKRKAGRLVGHEWKIKKEHLGNEPVDCRAYNLACLERLNLNLPYMKLMYERRAEKIASGAYVNTTKPKRRIRSHGVA